MRQAALIYQRLLTMIFCLPMSPQRGSQPMTDWDSLEAGTTANPFCYINFLRQFCQRGTELTWAWVPLHSSLVTITSSCNLNTCENSSMEINLGFSLPSRTTLPPDTPHSTSTGWAQFSKIKGVMQLWQKLDRRPRDNRVQEAWQVPSRGKMDYSQLQTQEKGDPSLLEVKRFHCIKLTAPFTEVPEPQEISHVVR